MTLGLFRRSISAVPLAAALLLSSFSAEADTLTGRLSFLAPQGNFPSGDHPVATGTGSFSFSSDLTNGLSQSGSVHVLASDLTAFNLTVMTNAANFAGASEGPAATYTFELADLTSIDITVRRDGSSGFSSPGLERFGTTAVGGNIPDYGLATLASTLFSTAPVNAALHLSVFSYPGFPGGPGFPNGASTIGQLAVGNITLAATTTPEPASFLLTAPALAGLWFMRRKKRLSPVTLSTIFKPLAVAPLAVFLLLSRLASADTYFPYDLNYSYTQIDLDTNQIVLQFDWQHARILVDPNFNDSAPESATFFTSAYNPDPSVFNNATCTTAGFLKELIGDCQYGFLDTTFFTVSGTKRQPLGTAPETIRALFYLKDLYQNGTYTTRSFYPGYRELGILTVDTHLPEPSSLYLLMGGGVLLTGYILWRKRRAVHFCFQTDPPPPSPQS